MSTYYYIACENHKVKADKMIAVERLSGAHLDNQECLLNFMMKHRHCNLRFFSEHDDERYEYTKDHPRKDDL